MGPDGIHEKHRWQDDVTPISAVEATWHSGVTVRLPFLRDTRWHPLTIEARCDNVSREFAEVRIHGGNTNDGTADQYEQAIRDYARAVEIARLLEEALNPDTFEFAATEPDDIVRGIIHGMPDYMLAVYLIRHEREDDQRFYYERGQEPIAKATQSGTWPRLDLAQLRARAVALALRQRDAVTS